MNTIKRFSLFAMVTVLTLSQALVAGQHEAPASNGRISSWFKYAWENKAVSGTLLALGIVGGGAVYVSAGYLVKRTNVNNKQKMLAVSEEEIVQLAGDETKQLEATDETKRLEAAWQNALAKLFTDLYKDITPAQVDAKVAQLELDAYSLFGDEEFMTKLIETKQLAVFQDVLKMFDAYFRERARCALVAKGTNQTKLAGDCAKIQDFKDLVGNNQLNPDQQDFVAEVIKMQDIYKQYVVALEALLNSKDPLAALRASFSK